MGKLVDGQWVNGGIVSSDPKGAFARVPRTFRENISRDHTIYKPESNRYHLYVSYACPWAHRALIYRSLKGLEKHISVSVVHPDMKEMGWSFDDSFEGATGDSLFGVNHIYQIYQKTQSDISTSATVPILWDKNTNSIVNNESSEIIRTFNSSFSALTGNTADYYPEKHRHQIDKLNELIYHNVNNGVYRAGFAKTQPAYDEAVKGLFDALGKLEDILEDNRFLLGNDLTEADIRLIPTLIRFDLVYHIHFKCSFKRIKDYKNLSRYTNELFAMEAIRNTTNFVHIKRHYYFSHESINPYRIIPYLPEMSQD